MLYRLLLRLPESSTLSTNKLNLLIAFRRVFLGNHTRTRSLSSPRKRDRSNLFRFFCLWRCKNESVALLASAYKYVLLVLLLLGQSTLGVASPWLCDTVYSMLQLHSLLAGTCT